MEEGGMLMISTGTGLSPHLGIVRDALLNGYRGEIRLYHGARKHYGHYVTRALEKLSGQFTNFSFTLCTTDDVMRPHVDNRRASDAALEDINDIERWHIYLSGNPGMVGAVKREVLDRGVPAQRIYADPFEYHHESESGSDAVSLCKDGIAERRKFPEPDPEMWQALDQGALMTTILTDFYTQVFDDERLSPYFQGVTRQRLIEKVYNFHYQMFTGEKVYFGERPRNAHHWMVISDELFQYRESIMEQSLRKHGLPDHLVARWLEYEQMYREDIVKPKPVNKILFGVELPYEGFKEEVIDVSTLCDSCGGEINAGEKVRYHVRMGTTYCFRCITS
jgi:truncated hemoglobin YjbI